MALKISKCYSSYSFHAISSKLHQGIGCNEGIQVTTLLGNRPRFKTFVAHWNVNVGAKGKIVK